MFKAQYFLKLLNGSLPLSSQRGCDWIPKNVCRRIHEAYRDVMYIYKYSEHHCPLQNHRKIINSIMGQNPTLSESPK